ncbi:Cyclin-T1-3 [Hibiscus syriacus]|uniref:Cyclin-T1-3 n=1 Tax=Hibiscus syriacus TaxID=106335 RepID=A0A6A2Y9S9_HIBSY|nr:Cyclin-T1-3 [Hibiscus syriacus]
MEGMLPGDSSHHSTSDSGPSRSSQEKQEEVGRWYFSRKEIEENCSSRMDGIDLKKDTYLRKSDCTFLQDLGMRLKVPQVTIATAIIFCHRFFIRQSHVKNDRRTIATVCMFLAGKVEETPRPLKDVILVSYEIMNKKDPAAAQRIKQKVFFKFMVLSPVYLCASFCCSSCQLSSMSCLVLPDLCNCFLTAPICHFICIIFLNHLLSRLEREDEREKREDEG